MAKAVKGVGTQDVAQAIALDVAPVEQRKAVEVYVGALPAVSVPSFLVQIGRIKKVVDRALKAGEVRVLTEAIIKQGSEWMDGDGVLYEWKGSVGDPFVADAAMLRAELEMRDVPKKDLDEAVYQEWKVNFVNLKNIENTALRAVDSSKVSPEDYQRAKGIIAIIREHRDRKKDGPAHLREKAD